MNRAMIEHGTVRGAYFGTSIRAVLDVTNYGKTCLLVIDPSAIMSVRTAEIQPFIIYFKPPSAQEMKDTWVEENLIKVRLHIHAE